MAAFELWNAAAECYEKNFTHPVIRIDLSDTELAVKYIKKYNPDIIIGGPPCQDFSHAGKRVEAEKANLTISFAKIIQEIKPDYFVMENVDRVVNSNTYREAKQIFTETGYYLSESTLDASLCGVPQKRKRFFCIGALNKNISFFYPPIESYLDEKPLTLHEYFGDTLGFEYYYRHPRNYSRRGIFSIYEPAPTMRGMNRPVPKGYLGHAIDPCQLNDSLRALTTLERALIQTFPSDFKWASSKTDMEQMIGNAVPVKLAEFVAGYLKRCIYNDSKAEKINA